MKNCGFSIGAMKPARLKIEFSRDRDEMRKTGDSLQRDWFQYGEDKPRSNREFRCHWPGMIGK